MKKLLSMLFPAVFLFLGVISSARAQSGAHPVAAGKFDVRFTVKNVDCSVSPKTLTIAVQVRATSIADTFLMGDANYRFRFKTTQLRLLGTSPTFAPSLVSQENFSAKAPASDFNYGFQNLNGSGEGPTEGIVSLNTFFSGSNSGAKLVLPKWTTIACIKFTVVNGNDCFDLTWDDDKTFPVTGMNEVYDISTNPVFEYKQANVAAGGYFGNVNACMSTYCSPILAENDINLTTIGQPTTGNVLTNDIGTGLTVATTPVLSPTNGTVSLNPNGTYTYTPTAGFSGIDTFKYRVCDNLTPQKCDTALVTITVQPNAPLPGVNAPPIAQPDVIQTNVGVPVTGNVLPNDFDPNPGQTLTVSTTPVVQPTNGTVTISPNGSYTYTPNPGFSGQDTFTYKVCDNGTPQACTNSTVTVDVVVDNNPTTANDKPIAGDDSGTTPKNTALTGSLSGNDTDPNAGQTLTYTTTPITGSTHGGTVTITPTGGYTYTPATGYIGPDAFTYKVCDNGSPVLCDTATVYISVTGTQNVPPVIVPPTVTPTTPEDPTTPLTICFTYTDADATDTHTPSICGTNNGTTTITSTNPTTKTVCLSYTPNPNFVGTDSICVKVCDNSGACTTKKIPVTVTPVNDPPIVIPTPIVMPEDSAAKQVCMPITDADLGDTHTVTACTAPKGGTATATVNNTTHTLCITYTPNTNFNGVDTVCVVVCDAANLCTTVKIPVVVTAVNDKPLAINDVNITPKATAVSGNVLTNDKDPDAGQILTVTTTPVVAPANGTLALNANGTYTYTPSPTFVGTDSFKYKVCDNGTPTLCDTATVVIEVFDPSPTGGNRAPIVLNDNVTTPQGTPITIPVKANDTDPDGNTLGNPTIVPSSGPTKGTVIVNPDGTVTYTPNPTATGTDSFKYVVCDNGTPSKCDTATVTVELTAKPVSPANANLAPNAVDDSKQTPKNTAVNGSVATNDSDPNAGQVLAYTQLSNPTNGTITNFNPATGTYTYTPNPNFVGTDQFTYKVCDNGTPVLCSNATVYLEVTNVPTFPPVITTPTVTPTTPEDGGVLTVCMPVTDPDAGDTHTVTPCGALNGTVTYTIDNTVTPHSVCFKYTPNPNFNGTDSVCVKVCDSYGNCTTVKVPVIVTPSPDAPVVTPIPVTVPEDSTITVCLPIVDTDVNDTHTVSLCSAPKNGTSAVTVNNNTTPHQVCITYTPNPNFNGKDTVCIKVCDASGMCTNVLVPIVVSPVNDAPIAKNDIIDTPEGKPVTGNVLTNDTDPDGNPLTASGPIAGSLPTKGTVVVNPDGTYTYTPTPGATGTDTFKYQVCDNGTPTKCDTATVTVNLTKPLTPGTNLAPIANPDVTSTLKDKPVVINVLANDGDPEGLTLSNPTIVTPPTKGTVAVNPDGTITYTPNPGVTGDDTFTYQVCDTGSPVACSTTTVTVSIKEPNNLIQNDPPVATDDAKTVNKNSTLTSTVATNDSDPNVGQTLTFSSTSTPLHGTLQFFPNGTFTYIPDAGYVGKDSFTYQVCDNGSPSLCTSATALITITDPTVIPPANTLPEALDDNTTTPKATPVSISVKSNDTYVAGTLGNPTAISTPANGTVVTNANGTMTYTPNPSFVGTDTYKYKVCDAVVTTKCDSAIVTIIVKDQTVNALNNQPTPIDDAKIVLKGSPVSGTVATNDSDPDDGQLLFYSILGNPTNGTVTLNPNGTYTYTPSPTFVGTDQFSYKVCDNGTPSLCANATAYITVLDQPCVTFDFKVILEGPYSSSTGLMNTILNQRGLLPGQTPVGTFATPTTGGQPYNVAPFNYTGSETMTVYPATVVDWVLVSLRSDSTKASQVLRVAGLLHSDGHISFVNPCFSLPSGTFYVLVEHRNHMGVMSATKVAVSSGKITYDFTASQSYQLTNPPSFGQKAIGSKFVMYAADGMKTTVNDNYDINFKDSQLWKTLSGNFDIYLLSDFNLDADSNFMDNSLWKTNSGRFSGVLH